MDRSPTHDDDSFEVVFPNGTYDHRRKSSMASPTYQMSALERSIPSYYVHSLLSSKVTWMSDDDLGMPPSSLGPPQIGSLNRALVAPFLAQGNSSPCVDSRGVAQSRQLTKKQLSGMAYTIRELAKNLARIRLKPKMNNLFILVKAYDTSLVPCARELTEWLLSQESLQNTNLWIEKVYEHDETFDIAGLIKQDPACKSRIRFWTKETCAKSPQLFDLVLALGGDGTVLYSSSLFQGIVPPVISFCLGSLGFLTKFDFGSFRPTISHIISTGIGIRLRLRLEATIMRSKRTNPSVGDDIVEELLSAESDNEHTHTPFESHNILNEVVIDRGPGPTMTTLEVFGDGYHYTTIQADGVCVATPTGSTAYNLAAGGSLCHPDNPVILVTAICAHTLSFRPIILPDTIVLRVAVPYDARSNSWVSFDGRDRTELRPGDYVTVSASRFPFPSILPQGTVTEDWIGSISRTLNWNSRTRQKPWKQKMPTETLNEKDEAAVSADESSAIDDPSPV